MPRGRKTSASFPCDEELVAYVTKPMSSLSVAQAFEIPGPKCLKRMRDLTDQGRLARPWHGVYAPVGMSDIPRPPRGKSARIMAVLDQPRTAAEVGELTGVGRRAVYFLCPLVRDGHAVHCGPSHYLRADLDGQFEFRKRSKRARALPGKGLTLRKQIMSLMAEPQASEEITRMVGTAGYRVNYMLVKLMHEGRLISVPRYGHRGRYLYMRVYPG